MRKNVDQVIASGKIAPVQKTFEELLESFKYCWVKINRGGPEKVEGILQDVSCDFVTLIVKEEIILIAIKHIKSVNYNALACGESDESDDSKESSNNSGRARAQKTIK